MISILVNSLAGGGAEKVALTLAGKFHESGQEVELICLEKEQFYAVPESIPVTYLTDFDVIKNSVLKLMYVFITAIRLKRHVKRNKIPVVHSHLIRSNYINVLAWVLGSPHKPLIVNHMMVSFDQKRGFLGKVTLFLYKLLYTKAKAIVSISEVMRRDLNETLNLKDIQKHRVIPNPHEIEDIHHKALAEPSNFTLMPEKLYIVSAGRLVQRKRVDVLIAAFAKVSTSFPEAELLILGDGAEELNYKQKALETGVNNRIHFLGHVQNPYSFLARACVYVLSSEDEGLPNIIIEALASGVPVISSDCKSGPREILSPDSDVEKVLLDELEFAKYGILFPVGNENRLAEALETVLNDTTMRNSYITKGKTRALDYRSEKIAREYLAVLT